MATPFTVKYPPKKAVSSTPANQSKALPINQSRVAASTAPNMSMAPKMSMETMSKGTPAPTQNKGSVLGTLGNVAKSVLGASPFVAPLVAASKSFAPTQAPAPTPVPETIWPPKAPAQKPQNTNIPQNPPSKIKIATVGTPAAKNETPEETMARVRKEQGVTPAPQAKTNEEMTADLLRQRKEQAAQDAVTGTQTTTPEQDAANERAKQIKALQDRYVASLGQSQEEIDAQRQLDNLTASRDLGIQAASEQPIEMGFITGQQKNMTERAAVQAEPLKARLAALQAKRQAEQAQAKAAYEEATGQGVSKPTEVGGNLVQFNPTTGKYEAVYTSPAKTEATKPVVLGQGETLVDPATGKPIASGKEKPVAEKKRDTQVVEVGGRMKLVDTQTGAEISDLGKKDSTGEISDTSPNAPQNILAELQALKNDPNKAGAVGLARWNPLNNIPGGPVSNFDAKFATIQSLLALPNLGLLKGAMSDNDLKFIKSAGSSLQTSTSLEQFDATLDEIIAKYTAAVEKQNSMGAGSDNEFANKWLQ